MGHSDDRLQVGDRVVIVNPEHPHHSEAGELEASSTFLFPFQVRLDVGGGCCVDREDVRRV